MTFSENKKDKLILALDLPDFEQAKNMVDILGDEISFYKVGLEMMMSGDYFKIIDYLKNNNKKIFADLKLYDIPQTIANSVRNLTKFDIDYLTIHCANHEIMKRAADEKKNIKILGVTALTCLEQQDLSEMGFDKNLSLNDLVLKKTKLALNSGLDGVVASGLETEFLRKNINQDFIIVTPGIRLKNNSDDDQKRVLNVKQAISAGSTNLVVGRPITKSQNPKKSAQEFLQMI